MLSDPAVSQLLLGNNGCPEWPVQILRAVPVSSVSLFGDSRRFDLASHHLKITKANVELHWYRYSRCALTSRANISASGVRKRPLMYRKSTQAVQCPAFTGFAKLRSTPVTTLLSAHCTCAKLRTISLGLQRFWATHNPLVHGSSPCGPTTI